MSDANKELVAVPVGVPAVMGEFFLSLSKEDRELVCAADPDAREMHLTILKMAYGNKDEGDVAREIASGVHKAIIETASTVPVQETLFQYFPMPTEMTRTSPFFIMSTRELAKRQRIENLEIARHAWGYITFSGVKLSIGDEDTLMVLLDVLNDCNNRRETEFGGKKTYMYQGPMLPLLRKKDPKTKRPGQAQYKAFQESLERLAEAKFWLITNRKNIQGNPAPRKTLISGIITGLNSDPETGLYTIVLNPWFYEMFCEGAVTYLELHARLDLSSQYAKALYRFITSHRDDEWRSHKIGRASCRETV